MRRAALASVILAVGLSGCGFTPLYGDHGVSAAPGVVTEMSHVSIRPMADRQGQRLRQVLREELQPTGLTSPKYDLDVSLTSRVEELGIRTDATSSRANFILS